jgi:menaquinone-dependent protoporphyrinogen oxidase
VIWTILIILVAIAIFLLCAPFFPVFQSMGSPSEKTETLGTGDAGPNDKKVLVAYVTRHGSTASIAEKIGETLTGQGFAVDVRPVERIEKQNLAQYDYYVIGSGTIWAKAMPPFLKFVKDYIDVFTSKPTAIFNVCMTVQRETPANRKRAADYLEASVKHVPELKPVVDKEMFGGRVSMEKLTVWESMVLRFFFIITPQTHGDFRKMDEVAAWAEKVGNAFQSAKEA